MFYQRARSYGWPEIIYYASEDLSVHGRRGGAWGLEHLRLLHEVVPTVPGGFRVCASLNGAPEEPLAARLDVAIAGPAFPLTRHGLGGLRAAGTEVWLANLGWQRDSWGYYPVRCGAAGRLQWHYHTAPSGTCDPHNHLTNTTWGVAPGPNGPLGNVEWELAREGIDDARLVATLRGLIARAEGRPGAAGKIADAEADLTWLMASIDLDRSPQADGVGFRDGALYEKLKSMLARHCEALARY